MKKWLVGIFSFIGGIAFTIGAEVGAVVVTTGSVRIENVIKLAGGNPEDYLTEEYFSKTILQLFLSVKNGEMSFDNLGDIRKITPMIDTAVDYLNEQLDAFGLQFDKEGLYAQNWDGIGDYIHDYAFDNLYLAKLAGVDETSDSLLQYLCFSKKDDGTYDYENPRALGYFLEDGNIDALVGNAQIKDLLDVGDDTTSLLYKLRESSINTIQDDIMDLYISDVIEIAHDAPQALKYLGSCKISEVGNALNTATLGDVLDITPGENPAMDYLSDKLINNLASALNEATLGDILEIDDTSHPALQFIKPYKINQLSTAMNDAKLGDLIEIDSSSHPALQYLAGYKVDQFSDALNSATLGDLIEIPDDPDSTLYKIKDVRINNLEEDIKEQTLDAFLDIPTDSPLYSLKDTMIKDIPSEINNLTVSQLMPDADFSSGILAVVKDTKVSELADKIETMTIGEMLDIDVDDPATSQLMKLMAPKKLSDLNNIENEITIKDIIDIDDSSPLLLKNIKDLHLNEVDDYITTVTLGDIIDPGDDALLQALAGTQITGPAMSAAIQDLELGVVIDIDTSSPKILQSLQHTTISNIATDINTLTIDEIFDTTGNKLLTALSGSTLDTVGDDINNVQFQDMIEINDGSPNILKAIKTFTLANISTQITTLKIKDIVTVGDNKFLNALPDDTTVDNIGPRLNNLKLSDIFGDEMYTGEPYGDSTIQPIWKYMLKDKTTETYKHDYKITEISALMDNMKENVKTATLNQLDADGLIDVEDALLLKPIPLMGNTVGECTISEFITYAASAL